MEAVKNFGALGFLKIFHHKKKKDPADLLMPLY